MVFDQSLFVKLAIGNVSREATIGLVLTGVMILVFLGSPRATVAVLLAVPLSMVVCLLITECHGRLHQHHASRRTGAGFLAPDR